MRTGTTVVVGKVTVDVARPVTGRRVMPAAVEGEAGQQGTTNIPSAIHNHSLRQHIPVGGPVQGDALSALVALIPEEEAVVQGLDHFVPGTRARSAVHARRGVDYPADAVGAGAEDVVAGVAGLEIVRAGDGAGAEADGEERGCDEGEELHGGGGGGGG